MVSAEALEECEPAKVTVYNGSVSVDVLHINKEEGTKVAPVYENMTIDGDLIFDIHPNLHKREAYQCTPDGVIESSCTDLVISRHKSSVRFGEFDQMASRGTAIISRGASPRFDEDINDGLGIHFDMEANGCVIVYTNKDDPNVACHGVRVLAPNFIQAQDKEFTPVTSVDRSGYTKIKTDNNGCIHNIHVKGSMVFDEYVILNKYPENPLGGWFFGQHSHLWFQPPKEVVIPERQGKLRTAEKDDLVISRGDASVVVRSSGRVHSAGPVAVLVLPVAKRGNTLKHRTFVVFQ